MSTLGYIGVGLVFVLAVGWSLFDFFANLRRFIAPDSADRDAINAKFGEGTPEAEAVLNKRFGSGDHWRDAKTALGGLAAILFLYWLWFD